MPKYKTLAFDIEGNGLLDTITTMHCLWAKEIETGLKFDFLSSASDQALDLLDNAETIVGHNIVAFDLPALKKLYGWEPKAKIRDTLAYVRLMYPDLGDGDFRLMNRGVLPGKLIGSNKLEAWGYRLGKFKGDYQEIMTARAKELGLKTEEEITYFVWGNWNKEMHEYCEQDVEVTQALYEKVKTEFELGDWPMLPLMTEHMMANIMHIQEMNGIPFNVSEAEKMLAEMEAITEKIKIECREAFPDRWKPEKIVTLIDNRHAFNTVDWDKVGNEELENEVFDMLSVGEDSDLVPKIEFPKKSIKFKDPIRASKTAGSPYIPVYLDELNPTSRQQVAVRLIEKGWQPDEFTETGQPSVNDDTLKRASEIIPIAKPLADLFMIKKRMSTLAVGDESWLKHQKNGWIHHYVNPCGAVTGRATHSGPNLAQVPRVVKKKREVDGKKEEYVVMGREGGWGYESRALFYVPEGFKMVGSDLSGIELRCLAHYMAEFDNGEYANLLLSADIHSVNQEAAKLETRDQAKTFIYALLYGAGDEKIGSIVAPLANPGEQKRIGAALKKTFIKSFPALGKVLKAIKTDLSRQKYIIGLDGRRLYCRAEHSALNTLLQAAGAIISKYWILQIDDDLMDLGLKNSWEDYANLLWVHDEVQFGVRENYAQTVADVAVKAAAKTGEFLQFRMPVEATAKIGNNWAETH